jgi:hypothetical protein
MPFKGTLKRNVKTTISLTNSGTSSDSSAATIETVVNVPLAQLDVYTVDLITAPIGSGNQVIHTFGPNVQRLIIKVAVPNGGLATLQLTQGLITEQDPIVQDTTFVYDVNA